jgi:signal transduction histidine kinase
MSETASEPLSVLLVEDNPNDARLIERYLQGTETAFVPEGIEVTHEETLEAARDAIANDGVDLLLLDLGLSKTSGTETFEAVREHTTHIPVIVLTGLQDGEAAVELLQRGAQDYLNKGSLDEDRLVKSIRYALERQEREAELKSTTEQLEVLNRILRHDVQNDVQVLRGWTAAVQERLDDDIADQLDRVLETSEHILELTENSREYIRLVTGVDEVDLEPVRVDEVLAGELEKAESIHPDATFRVEGELPPTTVTANEMLSTVFRNLLNNAVQHNDGPNPEVTVSVESDDGAVRVAVADDGPGVPDEKKGTVFGKGDKGLDSEGTGIGLYLVNSVVTQFGGDVGVADRTDGTTGAVFTVELPIAN